MFIFRELFGVIIATCWIAVCRFSSGLRLSHDFDSALIVMTTLGLCQNSVFKFKTKPSEDRVLCIVAVAPKISPAWSAG